MVRNSHHVNDLVKHSSEERDGAEDNSEVSSLESRVAKSTLCWIGKLEGEGFGRDQEFEIGQTEHKITLKHQKGKSSSQMDTQTCKVILIWGFSAIDDQLFPVCLGLFLILGLSPMSYKTPPPWADCAG